MTIQISERSVESYMAFVPRRGEAPKRILFGYHLQKAYLDRVQDVLNRVREAQIGQGHSEENAELCSYFSGEGGRDILFAALFEFDLMKRTLPIIGDEDIRIVLEKRKSFNGTNILRQRYVNKIDSLTRLFDVTARLVAEEVREKIEEHREPFFMWYGHAFLEGEAFIEEAIRQSG